MDDLLSHHHRRHNYKTSFNVTVGTISHHTPLLLQQWFSAIMLVLNAKQGLSAFQLSHDSLIISTNSSVDS